jgi:PAS domain-containing protein
MYLTLLLSCMNYHDNVFIMVDGFYRSCGAGVAGTRVDLSYAPCVPPLSLVALTSHLFSTHTPRPPIHSQSTDASAPVASAEAGKAVVGDIVVKNNGSDAAGAEPLESPTNAKLAAQTPQLPKVQEHQGAPEPANEDQRMKLLRSLNILDTPNEERFDSITKLVSSIFRAPIVLVSLVDAERQWFKSTCGLAAKSTPRSQAFCAWTLLTETPEVLVVENALEDDRFRRNPLVLNDPYIRFYAGAPLVSTSGLRLGTLCVIDRVPRKFDEADCRTLANFTELVVREIERDQMTKSQLHMAATLFEENNRLMRAIESLQESLLLCNLSQAQWPIMFCNNAWTELSGYPKFETEGRKFWDLFTPAENKPLDSYS